MLAYSLGFFQTKIAIAILTIALISLGLGFQIKNRNLLSVGIYLLFFLIGFYISEAHRVIDEKVIGLSDLENMESYEVQIERMPEQKPKSYKTYAEIVQVKRNGAWEKMGGHILIYFNLGEQKKPEYGDIFVINGHPREIEKPKNPFEFDYADYQKKRGIIAHHFLRDEDYQLIGHNKRNLLINQAIILNQFASNTYQKIISDKKQLGVANAMIIGLKDELDNDVKDAYSGAGAIHILAVSGLHVGIILLILQFLFKPIQKLPGGKWLSSLLIILLLWAYALFTGLSPSVSRATLMFSLIEFGLMLRRDKNNINVVAFSAMVLLIINPDWIFEVGFQLSYLAVLGIIYLYPYLNELFVFNYRIFRWLWQITAVSISAQLFTFPLSIYYFHQFPNYFWLTNPIVSLLSVAILGLGIATLAVSWIAPLLKIIGFLFKVSLAITNWVIFGINSLPNSRMQGLSIEITEMLALYFLIWFVIQFFIKKETRFLIAATPIILILFTWKMYQNLRQSKQEEITIHFIPRSSGISFINGKQATFLADSAEIADPRIFNFHLKNYYDHYGIDKVNYLEKTSERLEIIESRKEKILWINAWPKGKIVDHFEKVLISQNAVRDIKKTFTDKPDLLILDDSNSRKTVESLKMQADSLGYKLVSLYDTGGISF